jgi:hypothetical protein
MLSDKLKIVRKAISVTKCKAACAVWLKNLVLKLYLKMINHDHSKKYLLDRVLYWYISQLLYYQKIGLRYVN